jgi:hypothetical protein
MALLAKKQFHAGEWVEVLPWGEIEKTLDANGTCDGLPFMPEMMEFCGGRHQVRRYAENICVEISGGQFRERTFLKKDIVVLDGLRCLGLNHDGCGRLCLLFWKESWLRKAANTKAQAENNRRERTSERHSLKTKESSSKYFCQATQLCHITHDRGHKDTLSQCMTDLRTGAIGLFRMIGLILVPFLRKRKYRFFGRPRLLGTLTRTPVEHLGLRAGDLVELKSLKEMQATLDSQGRNRGLACDVELKPFCGSRYRVQNRLDRMISEATGQMKKVDATVVLEGIPCLCSFAVGGCARGDFSYFREIWLRKVSNAEAPTDHHSCVRPEKEGLWVR